MASLTFRDRYLWVQVEDAEGKLAHAGAFDHWYVPAATP